MHASKSLNIKLITNTAIQRNVVRRKAKSLKDKTAR